LPVISKADNHLPESSAKCRNKRVSTDRIYIYS
jgi:hypothetical protein